MHTRNPTLGLVIQWGSDGWTGGPNYLKNIALAVATVPPPHRLRMVFLVRPDQVDHMAQYQAILPLADDVRLFAPGVPMDDIDVLYPFPGLDEGISPSPVRVHWIPDFQHRHLPHFFSTADATWRDAHFSALATGQNMVVLSSQSALNDFKQFFHPCCPTHVLRFASSPEPGWLEGDPKAVITKYDLQTPFLMCCNQFWKHKDHLTLLKALNLLRRQGNFMRLVCTGATEDHRHPEYFASLLQFIQEHELAEQVRVLGLIDRADQIQLLRTAQAVVQPSLFEGWSTVIEDCRMLGKSVVYSDIPVHLEQAPPHGFAFKAGDAEDLARVLGAQADTFAATAGTPREALALQICSDNRMRFGLELGRMVRLAMSTNPRRPPGVIPQSAPTTDEVQANSFRTKGAQWYAPPLAGASTLAAPLFDPDTYQSTLRVLKQLADDEYLVFLRGFISRGLKRFGAHWKYADICTVLHTLAHSLEVERYLEIGVRQGRSMAMVVTRRPGVHVAAFDMWRQDYAGMDNPGPDFVRTQMTRLGHTGTLEFIDGNSHETLPRYFATHKRQTFDLITVDGDHTPEGAAADLRDVLPRLRIGGAIVFDDIAHPSHPELRQVWHDEVASRPGMTSFEFTELGYGVAFAVRMR